MGQRLPIIYVRGFAPGQASIDDAADDPFYGFNDGSTHVRIGKSAEVRFYQFEGPLLRLLQEQDYQVVVRGSQRKVLIEAEPGSLAPESIWVYRFYDAAAGTFGSDPLPYEIEKAAKGLADFIGLVRSKTRGAPAVYLVAHSMGGLICRTALQRELPNPLDSVAKLCTIGTPHGGIDPSLGGSIGGWVMEKFGPLGSDIFTASRMREYMVPPDHDTAGENDPRTGQWDSRRMVGGFPPSRVLSIVGTNPKDYGPMATVMGAKSDGLVAIRNAYVHGSARAYIHRSHSGRFGLVNSEEAYQNLSRFLFGGIRVEVALHGLDFQGQSDRVWQAEAQLAIRGLSVLIHEQSAEHFCPVDLNATAKEIETPLSPVPLVTIFLQPKNRPVCRYALHLKIISLQESGGIFGFGDHLEQIGDWEDTLIVDVEVNQEDGGAKSVRWQWNSTLPGRIADEVQLANQIDWASDAASDGTWQLPIALTDMGRTLIGDEARLELSVSKWD